MSPSGPSRPRTRTTRQVQKRISLEQLRELQEGYLAGTKINDLAKQLGIGRSSVLQYVGRLGLQRRQSRMSHDTIRFADERYGLGDSLATIGKLLGVNPETVRQALLKEGVKLRQRRGWK